MIYYSMRTTGQGHSSIEKFTAHINQQLPITQKDYDNSVELIEKAVHQVTEESMNNGPNEIKNEGEYRLTALG